MAHQIDSSENIISVSDITDLVDELRSERGSLQEDLEEAETNQAEDSTEDHTDEHYEAVENAKEALTEWAEAHAEELEELESLLSELCGYGGDHQWEGDWYPNYLIAESHFEEYMDEMVADCYEIPKDLPSFMTVTLDYDALKQDYTEVDFDGNTFYYR